MIINVNLLMQELVIDNDLPVVGCNSDGRIDFAPEAIQADFDLAATILAAHIPSMESAAEKNSRLQNLARTDALVYYRRQMIAAAGNLSALNDIYDQALLYEAQHPDLAALMLSKVAVHELATGITINLTTNQGKAIYLGLFEQALVVSAI